MKQKAFGTRAGFYLASLGCAFGIGNLWRFPYVVYENGGGAFVFLFFLSLFIIGLPLIVAELAIGKMTGHSSVLAFERLTNSKPAKILGVLSTALTVFVLSYYAVISGWVLYFFLKFASAIAAFQPLVATETLQLLQESSDLQIFLTFAHICIVVYIVARGVQLGTERFIGLFMPLLIALVFLLCAKGLSLEHASESLHSFLYPDFSKLNVSSFGKALGQALFTLGVGFGSMVTFGSYLNDRVFIPFAAFRVVALDALLSLFAGILIFPLIHWTPLTPHGPDLLFQTVPVWLGSLAFGKVFGAAFFLCLYLAAVGASLALFEAVVANLQEILKISRKKSAVFAGLTCLIFSLLSSLSNTTFKWVSYQGRGLFEIVDSVLIDVLLPIVALILCLIIGKHLNRPEIVKLVMSEPSAEGERVLRQWVWLIRWFIPGMVVVALAGQLYSLQLAPLIVFFGG